MAQADPQQRFDAAVRALRDGFAEQAAADLAALLADHGDSPLASEATLLQARALSQAGQWDEAADLLESRLPSLGEHRDQALYLLGEVRLKQDRFADGARAFRELTSSLPDSPLALAAAYSEALAWFRGRELNRTISLLTSPEEPFARLIAAQPEAELRGSAHLLLAESLIRTRQFDEADRTLKQLSDDSLTPEQTWEKDWLETTLALNRGQTDVALAASTNLFNSVPSGNAADRRARAHALQAEILRSAGRIGNAFSALTNNLSADVPPKWRRDALLGIAELPLNAPQIDPGIQLLSGLAGGPANDSTANAARIAVAELQIQKHFATPASSGGTDPAGLLRQSRELLQTVISNAPSPVLQGRAWFDLGWIHTLQGRLPDSTHAFERAATLLPPSPLGLLARFKLADAQQQAGLHGPALTNYLQVVTSEPGRPQIRGAVLERALYQGTLAAIESGDDETAHQLATRAVENFPNGEFRDETRLLYGQTLARLDPPSRAFEALQKLSTRLVNAPFLPEIQLAVARSYLRESRWFEALQQLDDWIRSNPTHSAIAQAEFWRAWAAFKTGDNQRAHRLFTAFLQRFPDDPSAPQAQMWIGNHLYRLGGGTNLVAAETSYQLIFQRTNWPVTQLTYEARLLAGRAAFARQGYADAKNYFRWLITNGPPAVPNSPIPRELVARAYFALGDCFIEEPEKTDTRLKDAMTAFALVIQHFPDSPEALLARGKLADCHFQLASMLDPAHAAEAYQNAAQLYLELMKPPADIATRSEAEVALGVVREKQAARAERIDASRLLNQALGHYLNVFNGGNLIHSGETASPFWVNRAGLEAARLSEALGHPDRAARVYETLAGIFPASATALRERAARLRRQ